MESRSIKGLIELKKESCMSLSTVHPLGIMTLLSIRNHAACQIGVRPYCFHQLSLGLYCCT